MSKLCYLPSTSRVGGGVKWQQRKIENIDIKQINKQKLHKMFGVHVFATSLQHILFLYPSSCTKSRNMGNSDPETMQNLPTCTECIHVQTHECIHLEAITSFSFRSVSIPNMRRIYIGLKDYDYTKCTPR